MNNRNMMEMVAATYQVVGQLRPHSDVVTHQGKHRFAVKDDKFMYLDMDTYILRFQRVF